jgi:hypothetical protein
MHCPAEPAWPVAKPVWPASQLRTSQAGSKTGQAGLPAPPWLSFAASPVKTGLAGLESLFQFD